MRGLTEGDKVKSGATNKDGAKHRAGPGDGHSIGHLMKLWLGKYLYAQLQVKFSVTSTYPTPDLCPTPCLVAWLG